MKTTTRKQHLNLLANATEFENWLREQGEGDHRFTAHTVSIERDETTWYVRRAAIVPSTNARGQQTVAILEQSYSL